MSLEQLKSNARTLILHHTKIYEHEEKLEGGTVPGLIQQLRSEIAVQGDRSGSGGKPIPMNLPAYTLLNRITEDLVREMSIWRIAPAKDRGTVMVEGGLWAWTLLMGHKEEHTLHAIEITRGWMQDIEKHFALKRETEIVGACPSCGYAKYTKAIDGEECITSTLVASGSTVTCQYCGNSWAGEQLHYLNAAINATGVTMEEAGENLRLAGVAT